MISPWRNPLPLDKYTTQQVVVYFYSGRWVPITFYSLIAAINLYQKAKQSGYELFIFPATLTPDQFEQEERASITAFALQQGGWSSTAPHKLPSPLTK